MNFDEVFADDFYYSFKFRCNRAIRMEGRLFRFIHGEAPGLHFERNGSRDNSTNEGEGVT